jgi:ATP-binding cassette subfamily B protein
MIETGVSPPAKPAAFVWHLLKEQPRAPLALALASVMYALGMYVFMPYFLKVILDQAASSPLQNAWSALTVPVLCYVGIWVVMAANFRSVDFIRLRWFSAVRAQVAGSMFQRAAGQSSRFFQDHFAGSVANRINELANGVVSLLHKMDDQFGVVLALFAALAAMYWVHPMFAGILLLWAAMFVCITAHFLKRIDRISRHLAGQTSNVAGHIVDSLSNVAVIRLFARRRHEEALLNGQLGYRRALERAMDWYILRMRIWHDVSVIAFISALLAVMVHLLSQGRITPGDFAMLLGIAVSSFQVLWFVSDQLVGFMQEWGKCGEALKLLGSHLQVQDMAGAPALRVAAGGVEFRDVGFSYHRRTRVFGGKNVTIAPGQKVGLVGASGSGKTTFAHLLLRLYDIDEGRILIDGQDIREVTQESLHSRIAMIPQDTTLFHRSLQDNIRYGRLGASDDEVFEAARVAHCDEFIQALPDGYATLVGDRGVKLSGGQRQRISIARAILKDAPILILDEATSALDTVTERYIQEGLAVLMHGRTTIAIAHRLSTLAGMDRVLVFNAGRIVEDGTHADLLRVDGRYARLWRMQADGILPEHV